MKRSRAIAAIVCLVAACGVPSGETRLALPIGSDAPDWLQGTWYEIDSGAPVLQIRRDTTKQHWWLSYPAATFPCPISNVLTTQSTLELHYDCANWPEPMVYQQWPTSESGCRTVLRWHSSWLCRDPGALWHVTRTWIRSVRRVEDFAVEKL